ncbi:MAG: cbb3-type cytochrome c oxidase subunit I [Acidimicrobiia bacterium]|nr:cbb3-type cytochrome c oxidase subunit I [Acidimicrobiia bacterium]MDH5236141.1 cbb3-type cytochrome c oxidase subunit I [Acidimicrobiia bacterium]
MTITEAPPETATVATDAPDPATGLYDLVTTGDHKKLGAMYIGLALAFGAALTVVGVVVGLERIDLASVDLYNAFDQFVQAWQSYAVGLVFLVVVPLLLGLATAVVPLQVGSPAIAFPRAAAAAFWGWLIGGGLLLASFIVDGGFGTPGGLADPEPTVLSIVSLAMVVISLGLASVCVATTVIGLRPAGMKLHRVPLFSWSMLVASVIWLASFGVLAANLVWLYVQFRYQYGEPIAGTAEATEVQPGMWAQIQWAFSGPQAFAWIIPVLGIAGETVPVAARLRQRSYPVLLVAIGAFGLLSFSAYAQPAFSRGGLQVTEQAVFVGQSFLLILPVLVVFGALADSLRIGARDVGAPRSWLVASVLGVLVLLVGVVLTAVRAVDDFALVGTSADSGTLHLAIGAGLLGAAGGLAFWTPKLVGRQLTPLTMVGALALAGGALAGGGPDFISGLLDQPFLAGDGYIADDGVEALNLLSMIGSVLLAVGVIAVLVDVVGASVRGRADDAADDPWGGHTLEWATSSPPPPSNFSAPVAPVRSECPLLDATESEPDDDQEES